MKRELTRAATAAAFVAMGIWSVPTLAQTPREDVKCRFDDKERPGYLARDRVRVMVLHQNFEVYRKYDTSCDGRLDEKELQELEKDAAALVERGERTLQRVERAGLAIPLADGGSKGPVLVSTNLEPKDTTPKGLQVYLRDSQVDIGAFMSPKAAKDASGATFGWSNDGIAANTAWSGKGVLTVPYIWDMTKPSPVGQSYIAGFAVGPWLSFNRVTNSSSALRSKEVDILSAGAVGEIGVARVLGGTQYLRAKGGVNGNFHGDVRSWSVGGEWQMVRNERDGGLSISAPNPLGSLPVTWEIDPIARLEYLRRVNGSRDPVFATRDAALRIGPTIALTIAPRQNSLVVPDWLQAASLNASFSYLYDTLSARSYWLLNAAAVFPIDPAGHFGVKFNYQLGKLDETGQRVSLATLGFAVKW